MTTLILIIAGIVSGYGAHDADDRAHMDGAQIFVDQGFAGVTWIRERKHKSDLSCWSGMWFDYERGSGEPGPVTLGINGGIDTECYIR